MRGEDKAGLLGLGIFLFLAVGEWMTSPDLPIRDLLLGARASRPVAASTPTPVYLPPLPPRPALPPPPPPPPPPSHLEKAKEMASFLSRSIPFKEDAFEYWSPPAETLSRGNGDCEDIAILFLTLMKAETGVAGTLLVVRYDAPDPKLLHAEALFEGRRYFVPSPPRKGDVVARLPLALALRITEESRPRGFTELAYEKGRLYYKNEILPR